MKSSLRPSGSDDVGVSLGGGQVVGIDAFKRHWPGRLPLGGSQTARLAALVGPAVLTISATAQPSRSLTLPGAGRVPEQHLQGRILVSSAPSNRWLAGPLEPPPTDELGQGGFRAPSGTAIWKRASIASSFRPRGLQGVTSAVLAVPAASECPGGF